MRDGRLAQVGTPKQVYDAPADLDVARFVGGAVVLPAVVAGGRARPASSARLERARRRRPGAGRGAGAARADRAHAVRRRGRSAGAAPGAVPLVPGAAGPTATVREVSYFGHDCAVRLQLAGTGEQVTARMVGEDAPEPGAVVALSVRGPVSVFVAARRRQQRRRGPPGIRGRLTPAGSSSR